MESQDTQETQETRRAARRAADQPSTLRGTGNSEPQDSWVHDVSSTGMRIESRAELTVGEEITVGLAGAGATRARVVWKHGNEYGCQFEKPLSSEEASNAFQGSPVVSLHQFGRRPTAAAPQMDDQTAELLRMIEDQPARGRFWMAGIAAAMIAVAAPLSYLLAHLLG
ncbi:PilZ domain-containing protein [Sphingomonas sp. AP4-R1]|uniref:PilZ domain-containing protein n=1 Tax=Sphingomonas sp. AP4-R1 TaxID=2735134 RepID=UPI001493BD54|nr:PilZ domain-containing protein [Sphingomonas sp. AP4-R1]QJU58639.1 PilZ domain-containing protein [Sphingomonas sp. AP4-R1]